STARLSGNSLPILSARSRNEANAFPLREIKRQRPYSISARARKPSYFSSKIQSGDENGSLERLSGMGVNGTTRSINAHTCGTATQKELAAPECPSELRNSSKLGTGRGKGPSGCTGLDRRSMFLGCEVVSMAKGFIRGMLQLVI